MNHLHPPVDIASCIPVIAPQMAEFGLQYLSTSHNHNMSYWTDKSDPCPLIVEYKITEGSTHLFRATVRGLVMGITCASPWVMWDCFEPRLKRMRFYADALRKAFASAPPV